MSGLTQLKNAIKLIYSKYAVYITPLLKFILALLVFFTVNTKMGYMARLNSGAIVLMASLFCSFMPTAFIAVLACLFMLLHFYALSLEVAIVAALVLFLMFVLYLRFAPKESLVVALMPLMFALKVPYVMPLAMGLLGTPFSAVSVAFGVIMSYLMNYAEDNKEMLESAASENMVTRLKDIVDSMIGNKPMICMIVAFAIVILMVYIVRRLSFPHSWKAAVATGAIMNIIMMYIFLLRFRLDYSVIGIMLGSVVSALLCLIVEFFAHSLDYSRTENLQFEDDEYYYYVKAVPKMDFVGKRTKPSQRTAASAKTNGARTVGTANGVRHTSR